MNGAYLSLKYNKCSYICEGRNVNIYEEIEKIPYVACAVRTSLHKNGTSKESCAQRTLHPLCDIGLCKCHSGLI